MIMGPVDALLSFVRRGLEFSGRSNRAEYWWVFLFMAFAFVVVAALDLVQILDQRSMPTSPLQLGLAQLTFVTFIPMLSLTFRRLHDTGLSSRWTLLVIIPFLGAALLIKVLAHPGERRANQWGEPNRPESLRPSDVMETASPIAERSHDMLADSALAMKRNILGPDVTTDKESRAQRKLRIREYYAAKKQDPRIPPQLTIARQGRQMPKPVKREQLRDA